MVFCQGDHGQSYLACLPIKQNNHAWVRKERNSGWDYWKQEQLSKHHHQLFENDESMANASRAHRRQLDDTFGLECVYVCEG